MKHKITRENDEYVCTCGLRWGIDEDDPHDSVVIGVDPAKPGADRTVINGHVLYRDSDFTEDELSRGNKLAVAVVDSGLNVCMRCGEYESGLDTWCKNK